MENDSCTTALDHTSLFSHMGRSEMADHPAEFTRLVTGHLDEVAG